MIKQFISYLGFVLALQVIFSVSVLADIDVDIKTSKGTFTLQLYPDKAPVTVANFLRYVDDGFYDNTLFHRAIPGFVIQGGGFEKGMKYKKPRPPIKNESDNLLKNISGTISMARRTHPDTATSQFYINLGSNVSLDYKGKVQPGYTVFGKISQGMNVINEIASVSTTNIERYRDVPVEDVLLISAKRKQNDPELISSNLEPAADQKFTEGVHYITLDKPMLTRDRNKIEVIDLFSYGCPHCYEFEPLFRDWSKGRSEYIDMQFSPAVWSESMKLYAGAYYAADKLEVINKIHKPLFEELVIKHRRINDLHELAVFFERHGVDKKKFIEAYESEDVQQQIKQAAQRVKDYRPSGVPEIVVNGKYRVDRMRAGGLAQMIEVTEYLVSKEESLLKQ